MPQTMKEGGGSVVISNTGQLTLKSRSDKSVNILSSVDVTGDLDVSGNILKDGVAILAGLDAVRYKGAIDASTEPNYPAADAGDTYRISVAGKVGGASGAVVEVGDILICNTDGTLAGTQAQRGTAWNILQVNIDGAVVGPASATADAIVQFNGTTGKLIKSGVTIDTDVALAANSDIRLASQKAVKAYADTKAAAAHTHVLAAGATDVTASAAEVNLIDGSVAGTAVASKAAVLGADKNLDVLAVADLKLGAGAGTSVTATAAEINSGRGAGVKRYVALLTQTGTDAPVATVFENSLGGTVVWTRISAGLYRGTLVAAFPSARTWGVFGEPSFSDGGGAGVALGTEVYLAREADDSVVAFTNESDGLLNGWPIEIRIYPAP